MAVTKRTARSSARQGNGLTLIDAPWRHELFDNPSKSDDCFICRAVDEPSRNDRKNLLLVRGERAVILLNRYPYTMGALMVAPIEHTGEFRQLDDETVLELMRLVKQSISILEQAAHPEGYNIGINQGKAAGAGLKDHLHIHVVPRWGADTNFMTTTSDARVLAEDVDSMFNRLRRAMGRIETTNARGAK